MNITIHRGAHQIGGNCIELATNNTRILLDIGKQLPSLDGREVDGNKLIPDVAVLVKTKQIDGVLISHSHGDHIGLVNKLGSNIPVFIGAGAYHIFQTTALFTGQNKLANPIFYLESSRRFTIGDFTITPYLVDHSGYDAYSFLIEANGKKLVYTGDFRDHGKKAKATQYFKKHLPSAIDVLLIEGTMMTRQKEKLVTEDQIEEKAGKLMQSSDKPVLVLQSSTNIDRMVAMYWAAKRNRRLFVMDIFTAHIVSNLAKTIPKPSELFKDVRVIYPFWLTKKMYAQGDGNLMNEFSRYKISKEELGKLKNYCLLFRSSMLSDLEHIDNLEGAQLIYSFWQGYKNKPDVKKVLSFAEQKKMPVTDLHTSGHASVDALEELIAVCNPKLVIPVHTENAGGFYSISNQLSLPEDGKLITI